MKNYFPRINNKPVIKNVRTRFSPEEVFSVFSKTRNAALLNSSLGTDRGRYSFIGLDPFIILRSVNGYGYIELNGRESRTKKNAFECLRNILKTYRTASHPASPFTAGGIGYFSYDLKNLLEKLPLKAVNDIKVPDLYFCFYRIILIFDNRKPGRISISILDITSKKYKAARTLIKDTEAHLKKAAPGRALRHKKTAPVIFPDFTKRDYIRAVKKVKKYIRYGDIYQACLSQRFSSKWAYSPFDLYLRLNKINPSPFSAFLDFDGIKIISSSPELFLRASGDIIETRPMKGTAPRTGTPKKDATIKKNLLNSEKDKAELAMITDLERNDLGKIALPGTVNVKEERRIETYPTVFQTISVIECIKRNDPDLIDVIKAAFPGGSITGCPKIRAMEIIDELEPTARGPYTGSIGYISFHNTMNLNIAIRTMIMKGRNVYFQTGGGIVADSDPEKEYEETLLKAKAMMKCFE